MNRIAINQNSRLLLGLFSALLVLQALMYIFTRIQGGILPLGNLIFGITVFGVLAFYYQRNNLWQKITRTPWVLPYCIYIGISFAYGFWRFRTPTTSVFDLWLFIFIPAVLLIPPFSFNARVFDKILAIFILIYIGAAGLVVTAYPETLYDRELFSFFVGDVAALGAGAGYLLLKNAARVNLFTLVGLAGVLTDAVLYGVGGAFRGRLVLSFLLLLLFLLILIRSSYAGFGWKFLTLGVAALSCVAAIILVTTRFEEQLITVTERLVDLRDRYEETGDIFASDGRLKEYNYFMMLNPSRKLVLGHGVGALWYDFYGMYAKREGRKEGDFLGARSMLHMNWLHVIFKIGFVGFFLLLGMLVSHYRRNRGLVNRNYAWWAYLIFYCAWMTYYGDKELSLRSIIYLIVLVHPWLFLAQPASRTRSKPPSSPRFATTGSNRLIRY